MRNSVLAAALLLLPALSFAGVVLHLKTGKKIEADRAEEKADAVVLSFDTPGSGTLTFPRDQVDWVEWSDRNAATDEFLKRRKAGTVEALCDAARWAEFHGMKSEARGAWAAAVEKDPACEAAHLALGHRRFDGKWMTDDEVQEATGHVKWDGKWITKEEKAKLDQGWEFVGGQLLAPDDAKRAKGLVLVDGKWISQKEAEEREAKKAAAEKEERDAEAHRHNPDDDKAILAKFGSGWRVKAGKRYRLVTDVKATPEEFDAKLVAMMDDFWSYYCETFDVHPVQKTLHNIVCYGTQGEYNAAPGASAGAYGNYQHGDPWRPAVLWYMEGLRGSSFTSRHECGHQFVAHYVRTEGVTGWYGEGIATTFECVGDVPFQDHLFRWNVVHKAVLDPGGFRFADMIEGRKADTGTIYCLGAATHLFFLEGKSRAYRKPYQDWLKKGDAGSPQDLARAMGQPLETLQAEFEAWVKDLDGKRDQRIIDAGKKK